MPQSIADLLQSIPMSPSLSQSVGRAREFAREQSHRALLLEHLLLAFTEDPDASGVLRACNVDISRLGTDISGYLGGLLEDMRAPPGTEPGPDPELLRVIEAARQAAQQSRRRAIDGAIVLAAIVGDGKTPAAGLLKAHGMTFDEAIRTLQKASAQARSKQYAPSAARTPPEKPALQESEREPAPPPAPERPPAPVASPPASPLTSPGGSAPPPPSGQSVDDILAAARARIQQRGPGTAAKPEPKPVEPAPKPEPEALPLMSLSSFTAARAPVPPELLPLPGNPPAPAGHPDRPPTPEPSSLASAAQALPEPHLPPPRAFSRTGEGPPAPPLPASALRSNPPQRAERQAPPEPGPPRRPPPAPNGAMPGQRRPSAEAGRSPARPSAPARGSQRAVAGPLVEAIPRRMRVGAATTAQVRINRAKIDSLIQLLMGDRAQQDPTGVVARVLTVRLKAPDGGFWIEAVTPETQWIEATPGVQEVEPVSWRWTVTPQWRGRNRMQLVVAARLIGRDGIAAEMAPPDRTIEVMVRPNVLRRLVRWVVFLAVFGIGAALGMLSQDKLALDIVDFVTGLVKILIGLLTTSGFVSG
jgi:hypothetical protein